MTRLVLHIGTEKTGSTLIQDYLAANQRELAANGWIVPDFVPTANKTVFAAAFATDQLAKKYQFTAFATEEDRAAQRERLGAEISSRIADDQTWVISSENFSPIMRTEEAVSKVRDYFSQWFDDIHVVVFLRRQDYCLVSVFSEHYKHLGMKSQRPVRVEPNEAWVQRHHRAGTTDLLETARLWGEGFGKEHFTAIPYLDTRKSGNYVLDTFRATVGLDKLGELAIPPAPVVNASFSALGAGFCYRVLDEGQNFFADPSAERTYADPMEQLIAESMRPYVAPARANPNALRTEAPRIAWRAFDEAVADLTRGPSVTPTRELLEATLASLADDNRTLVAEYGGTPEWQEWLDQPIRKAGVPTIEIPSDEQFRQLLKQVAEKKRAHKPAPAAPAAPAGTDRQRPLRRLRRWFS